MNKSIPKLHLLILVVLSVIFFFLYNFLNAFIPGYFNSPDENANAVFIQQFATTNQLSLPLPFDYGRFAEFIHPRSTFVQGANIMPVSFWGLTVFYGLIGKVIGASRVVFVTPFLAIVAAWAFYGVIRRLFNDRIALYSSIAFFFHPAIWYYTARSLFPNVPFVALMIIGAYFLIARKRYLDDIIGALCIAFSILIRPSEMVWIGINALILFILYHKKIGASRIGIWCGICGAAVVVYAYVNYRLFGSIFGAYVSSESVALPSSYNALLPFGFSIWSILRSVYFYFFHLVWWMSIPAVLGGIQLFSEKQKGHLSALSSAYFLVSIVSIMILISYYGDAPDLLFNLKTIGVSYPRYWIPVFVLSLPFLAFALDFTAQKWLKRGKDLAICAIIVLMFIMSAPVVYGGLDGLRAVKMNLGHMTRVRASVLQGTDARAIIVTDRDDKFFWPHRQVMVRFRDPAIGKAVGDMVHEGWPVYYFTPALNDREQKDVDVYIQTFGVGLEKVRDFSPHELYKLTINN